MPLGQTAEETAKQSDQEIRISDANLSRLDAQAAVLDDMRDAFLREKLRTILNTVPHAEPTEMLSQLLRGEDASSFFRQCTETRNLHGSRQFSERQAVSERIRLSAMIAHSLEERYRGGTWGDAVSRMITDLVRDDFSSEEESAEISSYAGHSGKVAYLRNTYTDRAFSRFAAAQNGLEPSFYTDFPSVCEALQYGRTQACILPLENGRDGKLARFYELMEQYDFRISMTCGITAEDNDVVTEYGLLRRQITVPPLVGSGDTVRCEAEVTPEPDTGLCEILLAAEEYGLGLIRADASPVRGGEEFSCHIILTVGDGDLLSWLCFLCLNAPQYTLLGIYRTV